MMRKLLLIIITVILSCDIQEENENKVANKIWYKKSNDSELIGIDSISGDALISPLLFLKLDGTCDSCNLFAREGMVCIPFTSSKQSHWRIERNRLYLPNQNYDIIISSRDSLVLKPFGSHKEEVWKRIVL